MTGKDRHEDIFRHLHQGAEGSARTLIHATGMKINPIDRDREVRAVCSSCERTVDSCVWNHMHQHPYVRLSMS